MQGEEDFGFLIEDLRLLIDDPIEKVNLNCEGAKDAKIFIVGIADLKVLD